MNEEHYLKHRLLEGGSLEEIRGIILSMLPLDKISFHVEPYERHQLHEVMMRIVRLGLLCHFDHKENKFIIHLTGFRT